MSSSPAPPTTRPAPDQPPARRDREEALLARVTRYLAALHNDLSPSREWIDDPDYALAKDETSFEKFQRDPVVRAKVDYRIALIAGRSWHLEPADDRSVGLVPYIADLLNRIAGFSQARANLAMAVFEGSRWAKQNATVARTRIGPDDIARRWWLITDLIDVDKRRLHLRQKRICDGNGNTRLEHRWALSPVDRPLGRAELLDEWDLALFMRHTSGPDEATRGFGRGLYDALYHYWRIKAQLIVYLADLCERVGGPWVIVKKGHTDLGNDIADLSASVTTEATHARNLANKIRSLRRFSAMVIGADEDVSIEDGAKGNGPDILMRAIEYCDKRITELCVGSSMPTGGDSGGRGSGAYARAVIEHEATLTLIERDRQALEDTLNRTIVANLHRFNRANWAALGLADAAPPRLRLGDEARSDPIAMLPIVEFLARSNSGVLAREAYERLGFTPPSKSDTVLLLGPGGAGDSPARD